jgi:hypothetical protein
MLRPVLHFLGLARRRAPAAERANDRFRNRARPRLEALEERLSPANYVVDRLDNDSVGMGNTGSLRYCISQANAAAGDHTITFDVGGFLTLTSPLPALQKNIEIVGSGMNGLFINRSGAVGTPPFRLFEVESSKTCAIWSMTIYNGLVDGNGGGILNRGTINLYNLTIHSNNAANGGGIYNTASGNLTISGCYIRNNKAEIFGGGIYNAGTVYVQYNSEIHHNEAVGRGGGIFNSSSGYCGITDQSEIYINTAGSFGGGIANYGTFDMDGGKLEANSAGADGGGILNSGTAWFYWVAISNNQAQGDGGGFFLTAIGTLTFDNCTLTGNMAGNRGPGGAREMGSTYNPIGGVLLDQVVWV